LLLCDGKAHGFTVSAPESARANSPSGGPSENPLGRNGSLTAVGDEDDDKEENKEIRFGEKLRTAGDDVEQGKDDKQPPKLMLTKQRIETGEEGEETISQVQGKLFVLSDNQWKERGLEC